MNQAHADYARQALRFTFFLGYSVDAQGLSLDVSEVTDVDGLNLAIKDCPVQPNDHRTRIEARFYPDEKGDALGGRLHIHLLRIDEREIPLPAGGVVAVFDGVGPTGKPELVDALTLV